MHFSFEFYAYQIFIKCRDFTIFSLSHSLSVTLFGPISFSVHILILILFRNERKILKQSTLQCLVRVFGTHLYAFFGVGIQPVLYAPRSFWHWHIGQYHTISILYISCTTRQNKIDFTFSTRMKAHFRPNRRHRNNCANVFLCIFITIGF